MSIHYYVQRHLTFSGNLGFSGMHNRMLIDIEKSDKNINLGFWVVPIYFETCYLVV